MRKALLFASLLIAFTAVTTGVKSQIVYKCSGNTYSQIACADGVKLPAIQAPDSAERKQADDATARDKRTADGMENARLKQEQLDLKANTPMANKVARIKPERTKKAPKDKDFVAFISGAEKPKTKKRKPKSD